LRRIYLSNTYIHGFTFDINLISCICLYAGYICLISAVVVDVILLLVVVCFVLLFFLRLGMLLSTGTLAVCVCVLNAWFALFIYLLTCAIYFSSLLFGLLPDV